MVGDNPEDAPPLTLTDAEWSAIDAIRSGLSIGAAPHAVGLDEPTFRRNLSVAAEKLRMTSSLAPAALRTASTARFGQLQVPDMTPCPYCENFAGRFSQRCGPPAVI